MYAFHFTGNIHRFDLFGNHTVLDACDTLRAAGLIEHVVPDDECNSIWGQVRGVTFALLEAGIDAALASYPLLVKRGGLVVMDLNNCHNDDFIQGRWLADELIITNPSRVRIVSRVQLPACHRNDTFAPDRPCGNYAQYQGEVCWTHARGMRPLLDWSML